MRLGLLSILALTGLALAGCSEETGDGPEDPPVQATATTGCIRGVVVDQAVMPLADATVTIVPEGTTVTTDENGAFLLCGLAAGTYFLQVAKLLYQPVQAAATVVAGDEHPPSIPIKLQRLTDATPYIEKLQYQGFYECAFAYFFITDSCDMAARTVHDAGVTVVPRNVQDNRNTDYQVFSEGVLTIIQEGFWNTGDTARMWFMVDSTPIDNACDCSDHTYASAVADESPSYARSDIPETPSPPGNWPEAGADVAIRGFVPFTDGATDVQYALGVDFQIFTTFFHNFQAPEGWNIQEAEQYPVPE